MRSRYIETAADQHDREADRGLDDGEQAAGEPERAVRGVDEPVPGVHVGGLDLCASSAVAKSRREQVRRPPLGVSARQAALERAQLADHVHAGGGIHGPGIIAGDVSAALG